jgi:hypothetical protein
MLVDLILLNLLKYLKHIPMNFRPTSLSHLTDKRVQIMYQHLFHLLNQQSSSLEKHCQLVYDFSFMHVLYKLMLNIQ